MEYLAVFSIKITMIFVFPLKKKTHTMINCVLGVKRLMTLDGDAAWNWMAAAQNKLLFFVYLCKQYAELNLLFMGKIK